MQVTYTLTSAKGTREFTGTLAAAMQAAIAMEEELQPAFGVSLSHDDCADFECRDGRIAVESADGDDSGFVHAQDVDCDLIVVAWDSGVSTRTPANLLRAA